jgi:hypothetical protein
VVIDNSKHGFASRGRRHYLYSLWQSRKNACTNPKSREWSRYGGRGITFYDRWLDDFGEFFSWVIKNLGDRPDGMSLDRIDNARGYEPGNLRWATPKQQAQNRRDNVELTHPITGETLVKAEWARRIGIAKNALDYRLENWSLQRALTEAPKKNRRRRVT